jgi:hypothetical protein
LPAEPLAVTGVDFAPAVNAKWPEYGAAEAATLRKAIRAAVARQRNCGAVPPGVGVTVTVEDSYRYFAPTIDVGSVARDPWADARLAIDGFAGKLATACRNLPQNSTAG